MRIELFRGILRRSGNVRALCRNVILQIYVRRKIKPLPRSSDGNSTYTLLRCKDYSVSVYLLYADSIQSCHKLAFFSLNGKTHSVHSGVALLKPNKSESLKGEFDQ